MLPLTSAPTDITSLIQWTSWPAVAAGTIGAAVFLVAFAAGLLAKAPPVPQKARRIARAAAVWSVAAFTWALVAKAATDLSVLTYTLAAGFAMATIVTIASVIFRVLGGRKFKGVTLRYAILWAAGSAIVFAIGMAILASTPALTGLAATHN
jgi:hypothetical protein